MLRSLTALAFALVAATAAHAADPVFPPGSRIGLTPPAGMNPARGMAGFQNPQNGTAIVAIEMPVEAFPSLSAGFADDALKQQGFELKSRDIVKIGGADAILISGEQREGARVIPKLVLLAAEPTLTALVIAQAPDGLPAARAAVLVSELKAALATVVIRPPPSMDEQLAALPFRIGDLAGFRPLRVMAGNSIMLTSGPSETVREAEQPVLIIATSFSPPPPADQRDAFARALLVSNTLIRDTVLERSQMFRQNGGDWHEIVAKATDGPSGRPVIVTQTIRFARDGYLRTVGIARAEDRDSALPSFRRIVDSLTFE